jgi:RimJ/RimL family protein N-acetyltransferase
MDLQALNELNELRRAIRPLLTPASVADALAGYYALWHDPRRTHLTLHRNTRGEVDGFIAVCQTGADLFRPLVTLRAPGEQAVADLLRAALVPHRPYQIIVPAEMASALRTQLEVSGATWPHIYRLDPARFQPVINVLVQQVTGADGSPRFQIVSQDQIVAMSGTNWRSPDFAEVFIYVHPQGRGRGWGRSVVSACTALLLEERLRPLYMVDEGNESSIRIAEALGYIDTGLREFVGEGQLK